MMCLIHTAKLDFSYYEEGAYLKSVVFLTTSEPGKLRKREPKNIHRDHVAQGCLKGATITCTSSTLGLVLVLGNYKRK
jgi:hypothetical protein